MARKSAPTIEQEELYPLTDEPACKEPSRKHPGRDQSELDDARMLDLDVDEESPFLRGQKRVSVRRGALPKKTAVRLLWAAAILTVVVLAAVAAGALYGYGKHSWRFRVESSDDIEIAGTHNVTRAQVMEVMGGDIGRNIFFVPLDQRKAQLEQIPWVESANVMRFVPNRLRVEIHERTPVAFARVGSRILLVDAGGVLMELPSKAKYSFPVILGSNPGEPLSTRAARLKIYQDVITQLDSGGAHYSQEISEVDLSDPDDVRVLAESPQGEVLVHLGSADYLDRYKVYVSHVQQWRQQFDKLESVDLRYDRQIIVNPDLHGTTKPQPLSAAAAKAAMAAGVKNTALLSREPVKAPLAAPRPQAVAAPPVAHKPAPKALVRRASASHPKARSVRAAVPAKPKIVIVPAAQKKSTTAPVARKTAVSSGSRKPSPGIAKTQEQP